LIEIAGEASREDKQDKQSEQWRKLIITALTNNSAHLVGPAGQNPGLEYGWKVTEHATSNENGVHTQETYSGGGKKIGWIVGDDIYLGDSRNINYPRYGILWREKTLGGKKMELTKEVKALLLNTARDLKGSALRMFMARTVQALGKGGQRRAERELGWNRVTIRKGMHEIESGIVCVDAFSWRGRKRSEEHLPNLLVDLQALVDSQSQADPQFRTNRLYTRLTAAEVRAQLIAKFGYTDEELPTAETIGTKLNELNYYPKKVAKTEPQKKSQKPTPSLTT
jgi:hypothetical protein